MTESDDTSPSDDLDPDVRAVEARASGSALPFEGLDAPEPVPTDPPTVARWLAFVSILVGGLLGGFIGYGTADVMGAGSGIVGLGGLVGAAIGAIGVGIVANLTLRAMNEWKAVQHPEANPAKPGDRVRRSDDRRPGSRS